MEITEKDRSLIKAEYPGLHISDNPRRVFGQFQFIAAYDEFENAYVKNPNPSTHKNLKIIQDSYEIEIEFVEAGEDKLCPVVKEIGGRLEKTAREYGLDPSDLHVNSNKSLCVAGPFDDYCELNLIDFLDFPLLQFLYDQSYFQQYGRWPRGEYSHGPLGLFENFIDRVDEGIEGIENDFVNKLREAGHLNALKGLLAKETFKGHHLCICKSGLKFRNCHPRILEALWYLQDFLVT